VSPEVVAARAVCKSFGDGAKRFSALEDVSLSVHEGQFISIVGPSGCGKSTLLQIIAGLSATTSGEILIDGERITSPRPDKIGVVFQEPLLLPWKTAAENIEFPLALRHETADRRRQRSQVLLDLVGLRESAQLYPHQLSGGMKQRVAIARGMAMEPDILLMDEPFASLDALTRRKMQDELLTLWEGTRFTVLFVTQSIPEAVKIGSRILLLSPHPGQVKAELNGLPPGTDGEARGAFEQRIHAMLFADAVEEEGGHHHG
jgi:NitT/TauT family transport system ATP-binding protein